MAMTMNMVLDENEKLREEIARLKERVSEGDNMYAALESYCEEVERERDELKAAK